MSVRPEQVTLLAGQIRAGASGIRSELDELERKVNTLRGQWNGEAQASYDDAQRKWDKAISELQELLERISSKTSEISQGYVDTDTQAARRFSA